MDTLPTTTFAASADTIFYVLIAAAFIAIIMALSNPHKLKWRTRRIADKLLSSEMQGELRGLTRAWGEGVRISKSQVLLMSILGGVIGAGAGILLFVILGPAMGILLGGMLVLVGYMYPKQRFIDGFPRTFLSTIEGEATLLSSVMYQARGIAGFSVQKSFEKFMIAYPETQTTEMLQGIPTGVSYTDALLGLDLPSEHVPNWLETVNALATINEMGNPTETLRILRDRIRARQIQMLKTLIKKKAFTAPAATVILILPGLMLILLGSIALQAMSSLSASGGF